MVNISTLCKIFNKFEVCGLFVSLQLEIRETEDKSVVEYRTFYTKNYISLSIRLLWLIDKLSFYTNTWTIFNKLEVFGDFVRLP